MTYKRKKNHTKPRPVTRMKISSSVASREWTKARRKDIFVPSIAAVKKAYDDAGRAAPQDFKHRLLGVMDEGKDK